MITVSHCCFSFQTWATAGRGNLGGRGGKALLDRIHGLHFPVVHNDLKVTDPGSEWQLKAGGPGIAKPALSWWVRQ